MTNTDDEYKPSIYHLRQMNKKPDELCLISLSRKNLRKQTKQTASRYNIITTAQLAMVTSTIKVAIGTR